MNNINQLSAQDRTSSSLSVLLTTAGFLVLTSGSAIDSTSVNSAQGITSSSASVVFSQNTNSPQTALGQLEEKVGQLWESLDAGTISATEKELEMAKLLLDKFPNNTI